MAADDKGITMIEKQDAEARGIRMATLAEYLGPGWVEVEPGIFEPLPAPPLDESA